MPINFGNNQILFGPPQVIMGAAAVNSNQPLLTPLTNGYTIANLSYTVTAQADLNNPNRPSRQIGAGWDADRNFNVVNAPVQPNAIVTIRGTTNVTILPGQGRLFFHVRAEVISLPAELLNDVVFSNRVPAAANPTLQQWNQSGPTEGPLNIGGHTLTMDSFIFWFPRNIGDSVTVTSEYFASIEETKTVEQKYPEV